MDFVFFGGAVGLLDADHEREPEGRGGDADHDGRQHQDMGKWITEECFPPGSFGVEDGRCAAAHGRALASLGRVLSRRLKRARDDISRREADCKRREAAGKDEGLRTSRLEAVMAERETELRQRATRLEQQEKRAAELLAQLEAEKASVLRREVAVRRAYPRTQPS